MIEGRWHGLESLEALEDRLYSSMSTHQDNYEGMVIMARQYVMTMLEQLLGSDKMRHFDVIIYPDPETIIIRVVPNDEVGQMLYTGTERHPISGESMPIGEGLFANHVDHPGTKGYGAEIDEIINQALMIAYAGSEW